MLLKIKDRDFRLDDLDNTTFQILIGSILGDGGVIGIKRKRSEPAYIFKEGHGIKQAEYVRWKTQALSVLKPTYYGKTNKPYMSTPSHPIFKQINDEMYTYNEKRGRRSKGIFPKKYMERLDMLGLLIWYLDDGHAGISGNTMRPEIKAGLFNPYLHEFCEIFNSRYDVNLRTRGRPGCKFNNNLICMPWETRDKIMGIWRQMYHEYNIPSCMKYKFGFDLNAVTNRWTAEEEIMLLENNHLSCEELVSMLPSNRSEQDISYKRGKLGISKSLTRWSENEDAIIQKHNNLSAKKLKDLLPDRTSYAIAHQKRKRGLTKGSPNWSETELNTLRKNKQLSTKKLRDLLPNRTSNAIMHKRMKLGIPYITKRRWSEEEDVILQNTPSIDEAIKLLPDRTPHAIKLRLNSL